MSRFEALERRVREECRDVGNKKAYQLEQSVGKTLGFNPDVGTWWAGDEFLAAMKPLKAFAAKRFAELEMSRVWGDAEKAALDVLKKANQS